MDLEHKSLKDLVVEDFQKLPYKKEAVSKEVQKKYYREMLENSKKYAIEERKRLIKTAEMSRKIVLL
jgi:hypothetical protein